MHPNEQATGASLKTLRKLAGLTLEELSSSAGTSVAYLSKVENGKYVPSRAYVAQVTGAIAESLRGERVAS